MQMNPRFRFLNRLPEPKFQTSIVFALTAIFVGYFLPWLAHPVSGLTLIGLDISEWMKFMPQMQSGELPNRDIFYIPPITLGMLLVFLSVDVAGWQAWLLRGLGFCVALISFPSIDAIRFEPASEWQPRLLMMGFVFVLAVLSLWLGRLPSGLKTAVVTVTALVGGLLPAYLFWIVLPVAESWLVVDYQYGIGFWLNLLGHVGAAVLFVNRQWGADSSQ